MRDLALSAFVFLLLPLAVVHPYVGVLLWTWMSLMNPHRQTWGFAYDFPFAQVIAIAVLIGLLVTRDRRRLVATPITVILALFVLWMCLTSVFALYPDQIEEQFVKVMKVMLFTFITMAVFHTRRHMDWLVWVIVLSLGFYSVKGGIYTLGTGGGGRVFGPSGGFAGENNSFAVATLMIMPLMIYLYRQQASRWIRMGLLGAFVLSGLSVLGSQSRGAFLAIAAVAVFFWLRTRQKLITLMLLAPLCVGGLAFMPETWWDRMETIVDYHDDTSALGRLNAWTMAWNLALDRFPGGGFYVFTQELFDRYSPNPADGARAAHSIYFQALGEHGFLGLLLVLAFWFSVWRSAVSLRATGRSRQELAWAADLGEMVQVGVIAYLVGGAFLSILYFDLPYLLAALVVIARNCLNEQTAALGMPAHSPQAGGAGLQTGVRVGQ